jgi:hypothetical protein
MSMIEVQRRATSPKPRFTLRIPINGDLVAILDRELGIQREIGYAGTDIHELAGHLLIQQLLENNQRRAETSRPDQDRTTR